MDTLVPPPTNNNKLEISTNAHSGTTVHQKPSQQATEPCNGNHLSDTSSSDEALDEELDIAVKVKQHKDAIKDVFMGVYMQCRRNSESSKSPSSSPGDGQGMPPFMYCKNTTSNAQSPKSPGRVLSYEEELQNRQQHLLDAVQLWKQKYKDKRSENIRQLAKVQSVEEDCLYLAERMAKEYQSKYDSVKTKLADIVCYADDVTQERNRIERELRESLEKAAKQVSTLETRVTADKQEIHRLRALVKKLEKEKSSITQEHNHLKQENDALWDKLKTKEKKALSPSVSELKLKYDSKANSDTLRKQCHILEMEREHYAVLLDAAIERLQTYECGLASLLRTGMQGMRKRKTVEATVESEPSDPTKIWINDGTLSDNVSHNSRFSDIEEEGTGGNSLQVIVDTVDNENSDPNTDSQCQQTRSRPTSLSEDFSENDSCHGSSRFENSGLLSSHQHSSSDELSNNSDRSPQTPRRGRGSVDAAVLLKKSHSSPGAKPKKNLTRSSSEHGERGNKASVCSTSSSSSSSSSQSEDKNVAPASSFGALRQRRGGVINLPPSSLLENQAKNKRGTWGRDLIDKLKKKNNNNNNNEKDDKYQSGHFWQRTKSRSVKEKGEQVEKGKEKT